MNKLIVKGTEINVQWDIKRDDFLSLTDIAKIKDSDNPDTSFKTGFAIEIRLSSSAFGKRFIIPILTVSNSMRLERRLA